MVGLGAEGGGGVLQVENYDAKGEVPAHIGRPIGLAGGGNNSGNVKVQVQYQTRVRRGHPPHGFGVGLVGAAGDSVWVLRRGERSTWPRKRLLDMTILVSPSSHGMLTGAALNRTL